MKKMIQRGIGKINESPLFKNSFWGIASSALQNIFLSIFFVIIVRRFPTDDFAQYLIATALYQLLVVFSTLGLASWFIREIVNTTDKTKTINTYFKTQLYFGLTFYIINLIFAFLLYDNPLVHALAFVFGFNIILDNIIDAIKSLNIAESQQVKSFKILIIDSFLLCLIASILYIYPFSILVLCILQVIIRTITINLFLKIGSSDLISAKSIIGYKVKFNEIKDLVYANWVFVVIGSISLVYWRSAQIIVSKLLTLTDVAIYGIAYKVFQIALIIPLIVSSTVYPSLVRKYNPDHLDELKEYYQNVFLFYLSYGLLAFTFVYSFADLVVPLIFGSTYQNAALYTKLMFLTILIFPTAILQANLLVAMKLERYDMIFNIASLVLYLLFCFVGLYYIKSMKVITYAVFLSFMVFHILQDVLLIKRGVSSVKHTAMFYGLSILCIGMYFVLFELVNSYAAFFVLWLLIGGCVVAFVPKVNYFVMNLFSRKVETNA